MIYISGFIGTLNLIVNLFYESIKLIISMKLLMKFLFESDITLFLQKSRSMDLQLKSMSACKLSICFCCTRSDKKLRIKRPKSKSLFISCVVSYFYETKFEIWKLKWLWAGKFC